jgi:enterochelin esterase family protein
MMTTRFTVLAAAVLLGGTALYAQRPGQQNHPPQVNPDGTVTFAIEAANAKEVRFFGDFAGGGKMPLMQKSGENLWSYITMPEADGTYHYSFLVDGTPVHDPSNLLRARDNRSYLPFLSVVEIRTNATLPFLHDPNPNIPHGQIHVEQLKSPVNGGKLLPILIYTPPGYEGSQKAYPVIYLMHGSDGLAWQWSSDGRMEHLADNLIAAGKMPESILVSPDMNVAGTFYPNTERYMFEDVMPFVAARYRTIDNPSARAIIGISRGGNQAFHVAYKRPELFSALGVFSINLGVLTSQKYDSLADAASVAKVNQQIRLFVYSGGMDDALVSFASVQAAHDRLNQLGVTHTFAPVSGDHAWSNWRKLFADFAAQLQF